MVSVATVAGEHVVLFVAGTLGLAAIFLALLAVIGDKRKWPYSWEIGFFALLLGSLAGAGGFWKVSGENGLIFLGVATAIVFLIWSALALRSRRRLQKLPDPDRKGGAGQAQNDRSQEKQEHGESWHSKDVGN